MSEGTPTPRAPIDADADLVVRGRCVCGRRYRIRNASIGVAVTCPHCQRVISVTQADLDMARLNQHLIPIQDSNAQPLFALPIEHGELKLAPAHARVGLTGRTCFDHEEAMFHTGRSTSFPSVVEIAEQADRGFWHDLLASFYLAANWSNVGTVFAVAILVGAVTLVVSAMPGALAMLGAAVMPLLLTYIVHFWWTSAQQTAAGIDQIHWLPIDADLLADGVRPLLVLGLLAALLSAPAIVLYEGLTPGGGTLLNWFAALGLAWIAWPVVVLAMVVSLPWSAFRVERLVMIASRLGLAYVGVWMVWLAPVGAALAAVWFWGTGWWAPPVFAVVETYLGFVAFRAIGLLYRHHRRRVERTAQPS